MTDHKKLFDVLFWEDSDGETVFLPDITCIKHPYKPDPEKPKERKKTAYRRAGGDWQILQTNLTDNELEAFKHRWKLAKVFLTCQKI